MVEIKVGEKVYHIAESMNELNMRQLKAYVTDVMPKYAEILGVKNNQVVVKNQEYLAELYHAMLVILFNFNVELVMKLSQNYPVLENGEVVRNEITNEVLFYNNSHFLIYEQKICDFFFKQDLTKLPIAHFNIKKYFLNGPGSEFENIRLEEYFYLDTIYLAYKESRKEILLNKLCATLFRPKKAHVDANSADFDGDFRESFNEHNLEARAQLFTKVPTYKKLIIFIWFEANRIKINSDFPLLFQKSTANNVKLKVEEELVQLCGGWEKYNTNKHAKIKLVFHDLHAEAKKSINKK